MIEVLYVQWNANKLYEISIINIENSLKNDAYLVKNIVLQNPKENFKKLFKDTKKRFTIIKNDGTVLFDTINENHVNDIENHFNRPEVIEAIEDNDGEGLSLRRSNTTKKPMIYFALQLDNNKIIRVSVVSKNALKHIKVSTYTNIILLLLLNFFALFTYRFYLNRLLFTKVDQIKMMLENGNQITETIPNKDPWLFKFHELIKEWQNNNLKNMKELELEKIKLNSIITSVDMGILLLNKNKEVLLKNNSINFIYNKEDVKNYMDDIKYPEISKFIENIKVKHVEYNHSLEEIYLEDIKKYVLIRGKYLAKRDEYLITLKDITRSKESIEIQKKFITNVGHELKTPLTNINGYLIALRDEENPERRNKFINTIDRNTKKLYDILQDFLSLSKAESTKIVNLSYIKPKVLVEDIRNSLENKIDSKNADLQFNFDLSTSSLRVDFEKISMVLKNLVENAMIYNTNVPKIKVNFKEEFDKYIISVSDNGIGISQSDTYKIFDRFYRVDKARTSNVAGTGLGLAIVSELIDICGGEIQVKSNESGTNFIFSMIK